MKNKIQNTLLDEYNDDVELGFIYKPNLSLELKTPEFSSLVKKDRYGFPNYDDETLYDNTDIVALGDSFTEGVGSKAEFSYPRQLARILGIRVLNLGHGAYDCYQFPIVLKRFGIQSHPKIVLMTLWDWNDLQLRYPPWREYCKTNGYVPFRVYARKIQEQETKKPNFYMSAYLRYLAAEARVFYGKYMALWNYGERRGIYIKGRWYRFPISDAIVYEGEFLEKCLTYAEEYIGQIKNLSRQYKFRFIVIYIPSKQLVYNYFLNLPSSQKQKEEMKNTVIGRLRSSDIEVIDMTPVFVKMIKSGVMPFYAIDEHLNKDGYAALAKYIADYLKNAQELKNSGKINQAE